jgi:hypothetical protein
LPFTIVAQSKIALWAETNATDAAAIDASDSRSSEEEGGSEFSLLLLSLYTISLDMPLGEPAPTPLVP